MKKAHLCIIILVLLCLPSVTSAQEGIWTVKADMPTRRDGIGTSVVNGKIYAIGGLYVNTILSTVEEYDPATDTWAKKANMPTARYQVCTAAVNGKIYAFGGWDAIQIPGGRIFSTVEEYDPATDTWTAKADMPAPRTQFTIGVVNGKIYVIGGGNGDKGYWDLLRIVEEL
jgi:N-acetylneuraminic acid mutarotase